MQSESIPNVDDNMDEQFVNVTGVLSQSFCHDSVNSTVGQLNTAVYPPNVLHVT